MNDQFPRQPYGAAYNRNLRPRDDEDAEYGWMQQGRQGHPARDAWHDSDPYRQTTDHRYEQHSWDRGGRRRGAYGIDMSRDVESHQAYGQNPNQFYGQGAFSDEARYPREAFRERYSQYPDQDRHAGRDYSRDYGRDYDREFTEFGGRSGGTPRYQREYERNGNYPDYGAVYSRALDGGYSGEGRERFARANQDFGSGGGWYSFDQSRQAQGFRGRAPKGYERSDERVKEDICERLMHDPYVDATEISVTVKSGLVTLEGTVNDRQQKHQAEDLVDATSGVKDVRNNLTVTRQQNQSWDLGSQGGTREGLQGAVQQGSTGASKDAH